MSKVLLIGGNGFIGSHLIDIFLSQGIELKVLSRHKEKFREPFKKIEYIYHDYGNVNILKDSLKNCDTVIHLAHDTVPKTSIDAPENELRTNAIYFVQLLELLRKKSIRIIYFSSGGAVYGNLITIPVKENSVKSPISPYGVAKAVMENYLYLYHTVYDIPYLILRPSNAYGERVDYFGEQGIIPIFIWKMLSNQKIEIWGNGETIKDYIYVKDLARAVFLFYQTKELNGIFNIGYGKGSSINEILRIMLSKINYPQKNIIYKKKRSFDVSKIILDNSKTMKTINWKPQVGIEEGIERTLHWIKNQFHS